MKIAFVGDIALIGKYDITKNPNAKIRLNNLSQKLKEYDYVVGNLESPLTNSEHSLVCKSMHLRSATENVKLLKHLNINAVSLANNHIFDFGKNGMNETIKTLEDNRIEWFGVDKKYLLKDINGEKVSFSGFCCYSTNGAGYRKKEGIKGVNPLTLETIAEQINVDKENEAYSIFSFHWGDEHTNYPKSEHVSLVKKLTLIKDMLIVGHHPHVIQGIQKYNNSFVVYSLGNCLFDDAVSITGRWLLKQIPENKKSFILEAEIVDGTLISLQYHGFIDDDIEGFIFFDIKDEIEKISEPLKKGLLGKEYEEMRKSQISRSLESKFGKRNWKWLMSRLNYYSVCARIKGSFMKKKYLKEIKNFL